MKPYSQNRSTEIFKDYLRKIGSGQKTSKGMTREEAAKALELMLTSQATPAQIGAFMIAHRIRRPEPQELAGMLDTYFKLGPKLTSAKGQCRPMCFGMPFDGRNRTAPIYPLTTLILLSIGQSVVLQGGRRMPIKYGITTEELFKALGLNLQGLTIEQVQSSFLENNFAFIHQPDHFPLADTLNDYRDEIGKRSSLASLELIWTAHHGRHLLVSGFVHPPTEKRAWEALKLFFEIDLITIKGLEGSTDLSTSHTCITARKKQTQIDRIILNPRDYGCHTKDHAWENLDEWKNMALDALENKGSLIKAVHWNSGVYLWFSGFANSIEEGIDLTQSCLVSGNAKATLQKLINWRAKANEPKIKSKS